MPLLQKLYVFCADMLRFAPQASRTSRCTAAAAAAATAITTIVNNNRNNDYDLDVDGSNNNRHNNRSADHTTALHYRFVKPRSQCLHIDIIIKSFPPLTHSGYWITTASRA